MKIYYQIFAFIMIISTIACEEIVYYDNVDFTTDGVAEFGFKPYTGPLVDTFGNGVIRKEGRYKDGLATGKHREYYNNKQLKVEHEYLKGKLIDNESREFYEDGSLMQISYFSNGKLNGQLVNYYPNGSSRWIENYKMGLRHGLHSSLYPNGQVEHKSLYQNDEIIYQEDYDRDGILMKRKVYKKIDDEKTLEDPS